MDETARAPYTKLAEDAKAAREAEIQKLLEEASNASETSDAASIDEASIDEESAFAAPAKATTKVPAEVEDNEITKIAFSGIDGASVDGLEDEEESVVSGVTDATGLEELDEEEDDEDEVEEHTLADGKKVLKSTADNTLYDPESFEPLGKWNEADNSLITA